VFLLSFSRGQFGLQVNKLDKHHNIQPSVIQQEHQAIDKIKATIPIHGNAEGNQLYISYSKNIFDVKKGEPKKVQVTERLKSVKSL